MFHGTALSDVSVVSTYDGHRMSVIDGTKMKRTIGRFLHLYLPVHHTQSSADLVSQSRLNDPCYWLHLI